MKSLDKILNYLILLAVIFNVCAILYFKPKRSDFGFGRPAVQSAEVDKVVNKYLQLANDAKNLEQLRLNRASMEAGQKVMAEREEAKLKQEKTMVENSHVMTQAELTERAKLYADSPNMQNSQDSKTVGELDPHTMTPQERADYKKQYIENAKRGGYLIELSDNFEIIKATPIRKPSQQSDEAPAPAPED